MAAPLPRVAGPVRALARVRRAVRLYLLRSQYRQQAALAAQIASHMQADAEALMALRGSLRRIGNTLAAHGELPPHLPDHIERGVQRCEP